jgi:enamine deaminase RidA (YjgF/YER057c/UK114 family)
MRIFTAAVAACALLGALSPAAAQEVTRNGREGAMLLESVEVGPGARFLYIGGHIGSPINPEDRSQGYGDTRTQTISTLNKIKTVLERRGYAMSDLIKMNIFVVADPAVGGADYAGVNAGFREFFQTDANPNTLVRTTVEIKGIQIPGVFVEIEAVAAR